MVRVKMLRGNETAIIDNGKSYLFDIGGRCVQEDAGNLVSHMAGALDLPIISLLSSGNNSELGVIVPGQDKIRRFIPAFETAECAIRMQLYGGFIKMLRRSGVVAGVRFNQLLFIYREGYDLSPLLQQLNAEEV